MRLPISGKTIALQAMVSLVICNTHEQLPEEHDEKKSSGADTKTKNTHRRYAPRIHDEKPVAIERLFTPKDDTPPASRICITGPAGSGKSTLGQRLVSLCSSHPEAFHQKSFQQVLWLPLRAWLAEDRSSDTLLAEDVALFVYEQYLQDHIPEKDETDHLLALKKCLSPG